MKEVTVIIPNYNGKKYLRNCLKALYSNTDLEIETIVVDNHSTDGSVEEVRQEFPYITYIFLDKNYGFSKAVNVGIQKARTPYVLLLNNDTEIQEGAVYQLLQTIKKKKDIFSVEAKMLQYHDPTKIDSAGTFYNALGWAFARGKNHASSQYDRLCETFAACGGAAMYRKKVFEQIGMFDESYFAYLEDIDIGYRAKICGYCNVYNPDAKVLHVGSGTSGSKYNEFKVRFSARNNIYLLYKNMPWIQMILNLPFLGVGFGAKALFFLQKGLGKAYVCGWKEGIVLCRRTAKPRCDIKNWNNYVKIQMELWFNVIRKRW